MRKYWKARGNIPLPKYHGLREMLNKKSDDTAKIVLHDSQLIHYDDVIMTTMASQITSLTVVYSTVYSDADQRKHQSSASLAFVWGIHRDRWMPRTQGQLRGKCFHLMTSSWQNLCDWYVIVLHTLFSISIFSSTWAPFDQSLDK